MATVFDVTKYILYKCGEMSTWKLQKLCFYSQAWHLAWTGNPIFEEEFPVSFPKSFPPAFSVFFPSLKQLVQPFQISFPALLWLSWSALKFPSVQRPFLSIFQ